LGTGFVLYPWIENLWLKLLDLKPLPIGMEILKVSPNEFRWNVKILSSGVPEFDKDIWLETDVDKTSTDEGFLEVLVIDQVSYNQRKSR
jgi:hypothetical protein